MRTVHIYTDGACLGNPGPGGWAAILLLPGTSHRKEIWGGFRRTTNNRMELLAAISGLKALKENCVVSLFTDSQYLSNAIGKGWLNNWRNKDWRKKDGRPVPNADLWQNLLALLEVHCVKFDWIKGHAGDTENERCDYLARFGATGANLEIDPGYENLNRIIK